MIVIEDTEGNIFGGYFNEQIHVGSFVYDPNSFLFSLKSKGRFETPQKFPIADPNHSLLVYNRSSTWLFSIGSDGGHGKNDDINIMKSNKQYCDPFNGCIPRSYNYDNVNCSNVLSDYDIFDIKHFIVFEMW